MIASTQRRIAAVDRARLDEVAAAVIAIALELELRDQTANRLVTVAAAALFAAPVAVRRSGARLARIAREHARRGGGG